MASSFKFPFLALGAAIVLAGCGGSGNSDAPAPTSGSATLAWVAPTTNSDTSPLSDLAGYRIYYGTTPGVYPKYVTINGTSRTEYTVSNLPAATYYFVVKAYDTSNNESDASTELSKTIL